LSAGGVDVERLRGAVFVFDHNSKRFGWCLVIFSKDVLAADHKHVRAAAKRLDEFLG
jgi:hypothetical protein